MAELIRFYEVLGKGLKAAHDVGSFVVGHLRGGAWAEFNGPPKEGVQYPESDKITKGEE